jgi:hypothetical protein
VEERYPIGETDSVSLAVLRHERRDSGYPMWSAALATRGGEATVHVPGHYPGVLADRLRRADERFVPGAKLPAGRDEYLELTALVRDGEETLALSSTARSPVRVTVEVPRAELGELAGLLEHAQQLIEELRKGLGLIPDSLPDAL